MIYFLRHCEKVKEPVYNKELDIMDEPLSKTGLAHAESIAVYFKDIEFDKIIVSQYKRAYQTALPTAESKRMKLIVDARVNEINAGGAKGMEDSEVASKYPEAWRDFSQHTRDMRFPGGESGEDVKKRQDSFLDDIKDEAGNILVVSHEGFIRLLMCNIIGAPVYHRYRLRMDFGGLSVIERSQDEWRILRFNQLI